MQYNENQEKNKITVENKEGSGQIEIYQSMQGFQKPRILKYSLQILKVSCGESHIAFLTDCGHLYTMGSNEKGKLGLGDLELSQTTVPSLVESLGEFEIVQVSCGRHHTAWVTKNGKIFIWGENKFGALGKDYSKNIPLPQPVAYFLNYKIKIEKVSCGWYHTCFLSKSGDVFIAGINNENPNSLVNFVQVPEKWSDISCGESCSLLLTNSGFVYTIDFWLEEGFIPFKLRRLETEVVTKIECNKSCAAITDEGFLYVWGNSILGNFEEPERIQYIPKAIQEVSLGYSVSACIDSSGLIWAWGKNSHGELGVGDWERRPTPYPVMALQK